MEWDKNRKKKIEKLNSISSFLNGKVIKTENIVDVLNLVVKPGDNLILEGDNQKQASFLAKAMTKVDPKKVNNIHLIICLTMLTLSIIFFIFGIVGQLKKNKSIKK